MMKLHIAQLYPSTLGVTGDRGNVRSLQLRAERRGIAVTVSEVEAGASLGKNVDIVVVGNGPLSALRRVHEDFLSRKAWFDDHVASGRALLSIGGSAELLGEGIDLIDGDFMPGLGVLPYRVARTRTRKVGYNITQTPDTKLIGFEDHASEWTLKDPDAAYGLVVDGHGSYDRAEGRGEFVRHHSAFAGNIQGPLLPLNPELSDVILTVTLAQRGEALPAGDMGGLDHYATHARETIERLLHGRDFVSIAV
jgi:CobQ-like glutamine amidotransferase family enzyme